MKTIFKLCTTATLPLMMNACATKESFNTAQAINEQCHVEMQAARTAVRLRDKGKPKSFLLEPLPQITADSSRLLAKLHAIVDETYQYPALNEMIYPTYRFELCRRELQQLPYPVSLQVMTPGLLHCQQQYGHESSAKSTQCISDAIDQLSPGQLVENPTLSGR